MRRAAWLWLSAAIISGCDGPQPGTSGLADIEGNPLDPAGRVMLINYWAEWCAPCREEIPELNRFAEEARERVLVLGVNYDLPPPAEARAQTARLGIRFPVLADDPAPRWDQPRPQVLPATLLIDGEGRYRATLVGPQTEESLHRAIEGL